MNTTILDGTKIRSKTSGATGTVLGRAQDSDRYRIQWGSGNVTTLTPTDIAHRFTIVQVPREAEPVAHVRARAEVRSALSGDYSHRTHKSRSRCPNPRDCGDPTCDGGCGY